MRTPWRTSRSKVIGPTHPSSPDRMGIFARRWQLHLYQAVPGKGDVARGSGHSVRHGRCAIRRMRRLRAPGKVVLGSAERVLSLWPRSSSPCRPRPTQLAHPTDAAFSVPGVCIYQPAGAHWSYEDGESGVATTHHSILHAPGEPLSSGSVTSFPSLLLYAGIARR
jgi:hypothetical protein